MGKTLKYGAHSFPSKFGFSSSAGDGPVVVRGHSRKRAAPKKMATGGAPTAVPGMRPGSGMSPFVRPDDMDQGALSGGTQGDQQFAHEKEAVIRGHAPLTAEGIAAALSNASTVMDPVKMGIMTGVEHLLDQPPGTLGGLQDIPGYKGYTPQAIANVRNRTMTMQQAQAMDEANENAGGGAEHQHQGVSSGAGPGGRGAVGGGAYGGMGGVGPYGMRKGGRIPGFRSRPIVK